MFLFYNQYALISRTQTVFLFKLTDCPVGIRVDKRVEEEGPDIYEHGEPACNK